MFPLQGIALDKWMSMYYMKEINKVVPEAKVQKRIFSQEAGMGFVCNEPLLLFLSSSFYLQNIDNLGTIIYDVAMGGIVSYISVQMFSIHWCV